MKKSRVILFSIIILAIVAILSVITYSNGTYKNKIKNFAVEDTSKITKIFMANKDDRTLLLERKPEGYWMVNSTHEVSKEMMNMFLETLYRIRVKNPVPQKSTDFIFKRMSSNSTKVEIYEQRYRIDLLGIKLFPYEKMTRCYYVGDPTQDNMGTFMLMDGSDTPFVVYLPGFRGFVATRYNLNEKNWRNHLLFNLNATDFKSLTMDYKQDPFHSFEIKIDDNNKISFNALQEKYQPKTVDTLKVLNFLNSFKSVYYEVNLNYDMDSMKIDSIIHTVPTQVLTIETKSGDDYQFYFYPMYLLYSPDENGKPSLDLDHFYIYNPKEEEFVMAQYFVFDKLLRRREYFSR